MDSGRPGRRGASGGVPRVAVVVNGTVAAVVDTYDDGNGPGRFVARIPPELVRDGVNVLTVNRP